tara:strand:- start:565 stop:756 length:192 start_codon:yes stop_codon:yes gene_type:complete
MSETGYYLRVDADSADELIVNVMKDYLKTAKENPGYYTGAPDSLEELELVKAFEVLIDYFGVP